MEVDLQAMARNLPPEAQPALRANRYFEPDRLNLGDPSPRVTLSRLDGGGSVEIGVLGAERSTVLIFGSYT